MAYAGHGVNLAPRLPNAVLTEEEEDARAADGVFRGPSERNGSGRVYEVETGGRNFEGMLLSSPMSQGATGRAGDTHDAWGSAPQGSAPGDEEDDDLRISPISVERYAHGEVGGGEWDDAWPQSLPPLARDASRLGGVPTKSPVGRNMRNPSSRDNSPSAIPPGARSGLRSQSAAAGALGAPVEGKQISWSDQHGYALAEVCERVPI